MNISFVLFQSKAEVAAGDGVLSLRLTSLIHGSSESLLLLDSLGTAIVSYNGE